MIAHLDETGQPCTRHASASPDNLLALAALGSRIPSFHHDAASKLQSLMMALDEISELADTAPAELRQAADTAHTALRELHQLFTANRALAKSPQRKRTALGELITRAAERSGVKLRGELVSVDVDVAPASSTHALATLLDLVAGAAHLGRVVDVGVAVALEIGKVTLTLTGPAEAAAKPPATANDSIALAAFLIAREDGEVRCGADGQRFVVRLPVAQASGHLPKL